MKEKLMQKKFYLKTMVQILTFIFFFFLIKPSIAKIYIKIDQFSKEKFPIAITSLLDKSAVTDQKGVGNQICSLIEKDLSFTDLFRFISKKTFLEDPLKSGFTVDKIDFANWAVLDAQALLKGWYSIEKNGLISLEVHLYDVLTQREIFSKKYSFSSENMNGIIHKITNQIINALTGEEGIFETKIAFVGNQTVNKEIYIMDLDGTNVTRMTQNRSINLSPDWSRDGKKLSFTSFKGGRGSELFIADLEAKTIGGFPKLEGTIIGPEFSPTQTILALTVSFKYDQGIFLFDPSNNSLKKTTRGNAIDVSPSFSPDGKQIVFASNRSGSVHIYKKSAYSIDEEPIRLTFDGKRNVDPAWSPKGDKIVFAGMDTDGYFDLFIMNTDGTNLARLTYDTNNNEHPSWSPDGQYIVFASSRGNIYQLYVMKPNASSEQRQITFSKFDHTMPAWSPRF